MTSNPPPVRVAPAWLLPLVSVLFFASGFAALVYQVMWLRRLSLVFGVTVYAASTVLAGFMAGLAIGSYVAGRLAGGVRHPLRLFGLAELGVGLTALASPYLLDALTTLYVTMQPRLPESLAVLTVLRFAGAFAVLIVPTALMGSTLPLVIQSALGRADGFGPKAGVLYATNTAGAILGALVGGFYLIADVGVSRSFQLAAAVNVGIAVLAVLASMRLPAADVDEAPRAAGGDADGTIGSRDAALAGRLVLWASAISGMCSLALEVIWFRMLAVYLRPTAYAFTIMLAAMLAGLSLGSYLAAALLRRRGTPWLAWLTVMQGLVALAAVLSFNTLARSQAALDALSPALQSLGVEQYLWPLIASSLAAILPTATLFGAAFPIGLRVWAGEGEEAATSRRVGVYYALNVCGAIAGSILAGFVLLPGLGSRGSLVAVSALILSSAVLLAVRQYRATPNFAGFVAMVFPVAFVMAALNTVDPFDVALERFHRGERELWRKEGIQTTVSIHERGAERMRVMYLDGNHQANDSRATAFVHHRIGALPVLLHPDARRALVVGLGGGATAGAVAQFPGVEVDVVELSDAVADGAVLRGHQLRRVAAGPTRTARR